MKFSLGPKKSSVAVSKPAPSPNVALLGFSSAKQGLTGARKVAKIQGLGADGFIGEEVLDRKASSKVVHIIKCAAPLPNEKREQDPEQQASFAKELSEVTGGLIAPANRRKVIKPAVPLLQRAKIMMKKEIDIKQEPGTKRQFVPPSTAPPAFDNFDISECAMAMMKGMGYDPAKDNNKPLKSVKRAYDKGGLGSEGIFTMAKTKMVEVEEESDGGEYYSSDDG